MRIAILGFPQVGKSSLYRILCGIQAHAESFGLHIGVAPIPDVRLGALAGLTQPRKTTLATLEFLDSPALVSEPEKDTGVFGQVRGADAWAHVVRVFGEAANPSGDVEQLETEYLLLDSDTVSKRLAKVEQEGKKARTSELESEQAVLVKAQAALGAGKPLRALGWSGEERKTLRGFMLLSAKPLLVVANVGDGEAARLDQVPENYRLAGLADAPGVRVTEICGKIELELAELEESEAGEFLLSFGLRESARDRVLHTACQLLDLLTFFTVSESECRAWLAPRGTVALEAAGMIHSDFARGFIKAEVIPWKELVEAGSLAAAREQGRVRLEGKQHEIHDGDVVYIRHGA